MRTTLDETAALMRAAGIVEPLRFSAALADGERLHVFRCASDDKPPTLYLQQGERGTIVASEPLDDGDWRPLKNGEMLTISRSKKRVAGSALV